MRYVGLDLSLTHAGVAVREHGMETRVGVIQSKPKGSTIEDRARRIQTLGGEILEFVHQGRAGEPEPTVVCVEAPPYGATLNQGSQHDRAYLWWNVVMLFVGAQEPVTEVSPTSVKAFGTGKGNASKAEMMARCAQEHPGVDFIDDNGCDALWLADMAASHADPEVAPVELFAYRQKALKAVHWEW